jgi:hypothetical protein
VIRRVRRMVMRQVAPVKHFWLRIHESNVGRVVYPPNV